VSHQTYVVVAIARLPTTCGQCHLGPDHSQLEIYEESKHGIMFHAQERLLNLNAAPKTLTTRDMFVPTCATCHMSGINGQKVTHDPSERLSYYLADPITRARSNPERAQAAMKQVCGQCHTSPLVERVYSEAEKVVVSTNENVQAASEVMAGLRKDGILTGPPFAHPIDLCVLRSVALRRPDLEARRIHGRSGFRPMARQLSHAREIGGAEDSGRGASTTA
jgi:hydroxylamine dehydrogenase